MVELGFAALGFGLGIITVYFIQVLPLTKLIAQMRKEGYIMNYPIPERKLDPDESWRDIAEG